MSSLSAEITSISDGIRKLALQATNNLDNSDPAYKIAKFRSIRPIDYMRYAEFDAILQGLVIKPQMKILDVSSPQWFSIFLAQQYPETTFYYINIIESELEAYKKIGQALGITNLIYSKEDVRNLTFDDDSFDKIISISVIEHIYPEEGGDYQALKEIKRVLKPQGKFLMTVPYKDQRNIVYLDKAVYERGKQNNNFFAREYDREMFDTLIEQSEYTVKNQWFICETPGLLAIDYYEYGPGTKIFFVKYLLKLRKLVEKVINKSLDQLLAERYLFVSSQIGVRVVNICVSLIPN